MKYRKLRIAWSVAWGILAILLCLLWWQSYTSFHLVIFKGTSLTMAYSRPGLVFVESGDTNFSGMGNEHWTFGRMPLSDSQPTESMFIPSRIHETLSAGSGICMPIWELIVSLIPIAAIPWLRWRFSLRTLLIGMTVAAIGLGWLVYASGK